MAMNTIAEIATRLGTVHSGKQLRNLAAGGGCWFDTLLQELSEIDGHEDDVETLANFAHAGLMSPEWALIQSLLSVGKHLHDNPSAAKAYERADQHRR
jgi:hypothetical protein